MATVLDTNIIIELVRGNKEIIELLKDVDKEYYITSITKFEILVGVPKEEELFWINFFPTLDFDSKAAEIAASIFKQLEKQGKLIELKNLFIGAVCIANNLPLLTLNKKHFERLKEFGLELIDFNI